MATTRGRRKRRVIAIANRQSRRALRDASDSHLDTRDRQVVVSQRAPDGARRWAFSCLRDAGVSASPCTVRNALEALLQWALVLGAMCTCMGAIGPGYRCGKDRAYVAAMKSDLRNLQTAQEVFREEHGRYATSASELADVFRSSTGVRITVAGNGRQWAAKATHVAIKGGCAFGGEAGDAPQCSGIRSARVSPEKYFANITVDLWLFAISVSRRRHRRRAEYSGEL